MYKKKYSSLFSKNHRFRESPQNVFGLNPLYALQQVFSNIRKIDELTEIRKNGPINLSPQGFHFN